MVLNRGILGVTPQGTDEYSQPPKLATIMPESTAAKAGIKVGDVITEIDGHSVHNYAQVRHALGSKYEGDVVTVKVLRGTEEKVFKDLHLGGVQAAYGLAILGFLPMRDDPALGVEVRYIYPKGPADAAGVKEGDRIMKIGGMQGPLQPFSGRDQLANLLATATPNTQVKIEVIRKDKKTETLTLTLGEDPNKGAADEVPDKLPEEASLKKALEPRKLVGPGPKPGRKPAPAPNKEDKKVETGVLQRKNAAATHSYWIYVPRDYDPNISYALLVWLHPVGKDKEKDDEDLQDAWFSFCRENHIILVAPKAENKTGWVPSESDVIAEITRDIMATYTVDRRRWWRTAWGWAGSSPFTSASTTATCSAAWPSPAPPWPASPRRRCPTSRFPSTCTPAARTR